MSYNSIGAYRRTQVETARPEEVLLQLMEKAVRHARQGQARGEAKDPVGAREHAVRLLNIVTELDGSLDREQGGELVEELQALYAYLIREISEGNRKGEFERLADVESVLRTLYQGWKDAVAELQEQAGDNAAPAAAGQSV
ncbi:flagellar export chaperone FliS [Thiohalorhabdus sp.]|uniref:flagellar export chaperone FliS n=1 Tax=Thiohalorhabdus sp. TaxID=3094134 RepID=UPI002FC334F6